MLPLSLEEALLLYFSFSGVSNSRKMMQRGVGNILLSPSPTTKLQNESLDGGIEPTTTSGK